MTLSFLFSTGAGAGGTIFSGLLSVDLLMGYPSIVGRHYCRPTTHSPADEPVGVPAGAARRPRFTSNSNASLQRQVEGKVASVCDFASFTSTADEDAACPGGASGLAYSVGERLRGSRGEHQGLRFQRFTFFRTEAISSSLILPSSFFR